MPHLNTKLPYESTTIPPEQTQFHITAMLNEFYRIDPESKKKTAWVNGIRWTDLPDQMPTLEFMMEYDTPEGVHKSVGVRVQPPLLAIPKKQKRGCGSQVVWEPAKAQSMRLMYYWMKSKLEAVLWGMRDFTEEFMGDVLVRTPDQGLQRISQLIIPQLEQNKVPALTFKEGP